MTPTEALDVVREVLQGTVDKNTVTDVRPALAVLEGVVKSNEHVRGLCTPPWVAPELRPYTSPPRTVLVSEILHALDGTAS